MTSPLRRLAALMVADAAEPRSVRSRRRRLRLMLGQFWLVLIASIFLVTALIGGAFYFSNRPTVLRIAVGPAGGLDARVVQAIAQHVARDRGAGIRLVPVTKEGPAEAARALDNHETELAVVRRDVAFPQNGQALVVLHDNLAVFVVPAEGSLAAGGAKAAPQPPAAKPPSGRTRRGRSAEAEPPSPPARIETIEDLAGHRIGLVGAGPNNREVLNVILRQYQVATDKITVVPLDMKDVATSLRNTPVDAILALGPVASPFIADVIAASSNGKTAPTFLEIGASEAITARFPVYEQSEIKAGVFGGQSPLPPEDVETIGFKHYIVARRSLPDDTAGDLTRLLFSVRQSLAGDLPGAARIEKPDTDRDAAVPAHPGAAAWIDNEQKTFFDKYSDFIYLGVMAMSGFASGLAWLASYFRADTRVRRLKLLERLLEIVKSARAATTLSELARLREETDDILRNTLQQVERNTLDASALAAFSLALDQAQMAISDRRQQIDAGEDGAKPAAAAEAGPASASEDGRASTIQPLRVARSSHDAF